MRLPSAAFPLLLALSLLSAGCSPTFNWREHRMPPTPLQGLLPCRPDEAVRTVTLGDGPVEMRMAGCEAGGATFAIAYVRADPARLGALLGRWQDATLANLGHAPGPDAPAGRAFVPPGALALPQSVRIAADGRGADGAPVSARAVWFAGGDAGATYAFQAVVYAPHPADEAADAFFAALRLR
ncbi:MAG: hypothetical protein PGN26_03340 [Xylophilus ampelinus]